MREEHLQAAARSGAWNRDRVYRLLPRLEARRRNLGNQLSGGEQQMLAIGRGLMTHPQLLLLDAGSARGRGLSAHSRCGAGAESHVARVEFC